MDSPAFAPRSTGCVYEPATSVPAPTAFSPQSNTELKSAVDALAMCSTTIPATTPAPVFSPQTEEELHSAVEEYLRLHDNVLSSYGPIGEWDVSRVTDMSGIFYGAGAFNGDISKWDVSRVASMKG